MLSEKMSNRLKHENSGGKGQSAHPHSRLEDVLNNVDSAGEKHKGVCQAVGMQSLIRAKFSANG